MKPTTCTEALRIPLIMLEATKSVFQCAHIKRGNITLIPKEATEEEKKEILQLKTKKTKRKIIRIILLKMKMNTTTTRWE